MFAELDKSKSISTRFLIFEKLKIKREKNHR